MSVKLIAVDMDGTFLNDKKTYNRERFRQQGARGTGLFANRRKGGKAGY